jgi:hypothetical protein
MFFPLVRGFLGVVRPEGLPAVDDLMRQAGLLLAKPSLREEKWFLTTREVPFSRRAWD